MRSFLMIAGLAGLLASASPAFAAGGPGNSDRNPGQQNPIVLAHGESDWGQPNNQPWSNPNGGYNSNHNPGGYGSGWNGPGANHNPGPGWNNGQYQHQPLPRPVIKARLQHQQFHDIGDWRFKNGYYRVRAEDRYGHDVKLIVNAYSGQIVSVNRD
ncbi:MAG TPA: hypothetical protein VHA10_21450 [Hypericibacter adhaerens]|uniref:PepSY domain-containing protein n=1 Tax=Hypericibacter adhaerens TaxID=2602016 RepID=A0A5J6N438_9PROT|nr:hypothetical protein [Hypericibacter adhaerens]QEX24589.1 hypothetical protein FRZ61_45300 [Hypericibacter adhaerens]HWA45800.1 hypothetical protein [Hypericibacter adhaerens]